MGKRMLQLTSVLTGLVLAGAAASPLIGDVERVPATAAVAAPVGADSVPASAVSPRTVSARTLLKALPVRGESHGSTYSRAQFGGWIDADDDCANTRAEVLRAESTKAVVANASCTVKTGGWTSKYDGKRFTAATYLDIDHLVPLKEAWTSGADAWSARKRAAYANDLGYGASLIAVSVHANRAKSDQEPTTWLPAATGYRCAYLRNWIGVKYRWGLAVDPAERTALSRGLAKYCTSSSVLVRKPGVPKLAALVGTAATPAPPTKPKPAPKPGTDPDYGTCAGANAAGAHTPYYRGIDPEYAYYRDRDGDGVVCE